MKKSFTKIWIAIFAILGCVASVAPVSAQEKELTAEQRAELELQLKKLGERLQKEIGPKAEAAAKRAEKMAKELELQFSDMAKQFENFELKNLSKLEGIIKKEQGRILRMSKLMEKDWAEFAKQFENMAKELEANPEKWEELSKHFQKKAAEAKRKFAVDGDKLAQIAKEASKGVTSRADAYRKKGLDMARAQIKRQLKQTKDKRSRAELERLIEMLQKVEHDSAIKARNDKKRAAKKNAAYRKELEVAKSLSQLKGLVKKSNRGKDLVDTAEILESVKKMQSELDAKRKDLHNKYTERMKKLQREMKKADPETANQIERAMKMVRMSLDQANKEIEVQLEKVTKEHIAAAVAKAKKAAEAARAEKLGNFAEAASRYEDARKEAIAKKIAEAMQAKKRAIAKNDLQRQRDQKQAAKAKEIAEMYKNVAKQRGLIQKNDAVIENLRNEIRALRNEIERLKKDQ